MRELFLACFVFGLLFTVTSFLLGALGSGHIDIPGLDLHFDHLGGAHGHAQSGTHLSPFNLSTISAFLAWFGGAGYLMSRYSHFTGAVITGVATAAGVVGGGIVFVTLTRYVMPRLTVMRPEDYRLPGMVARVTSAIRPGGTGEIVYTLGGSRHADGARSATGEALERDTEVVILRVEKGIAYVERWTKFADTNQLPPGNDGAALP